MNQQQLVQTLQQAVQLHQLGQLSTAIELYQIVLSRVPANFDALRLMGVAKMQLGQVAEAITLLKKARGIQPRSAELLGHLGLAYKNAGEFELAQKTYEDALKLAPTDLNTLLNLGALWMIQGQPLQAALVFQRAAGAHPQAPLPQVQLGEAFLAAGQTAEAIEAFEVILKRDERSVDALLGKGRGYLQQGSLGEAADTLQSAVNHHPKNPHAHNTLGQAFQRRHQYENAAEHFQRAAELDPNLAAALNNLGGALFEVADAEEAIAAYDKALAIDPTLIPGWLNRAIATYDQQNLTPSIESLRKANDLGDTPLARAYQAILEHQEDSSEPLPDPTGWDHDEARSILESYVYLMEQAPKATCLARQRDIHRFAWEASEGEGLILEFGVFFGHSIRYLASLTDATVHGFDSFEGIPEGWFNEEAAGAYSTAGDIPPVPDNVELHAGWFSDTLPPFVAEHTGPVRLVNIDCDIYSSTQCIFEHLGDQMKVGSILVFDEYGFYPGWQDHEHKAFMEFIEASGMTYEILAYSLFSRQVVVRLNSPAPE